MSKQNNGLGRGLDALFGTDAAVLEKIQFGGHEIQELPLDQLGANPDQPRRHFDDQSLAELAVSIKEHGVLQPLIVVKNEQNSYTIIAGERRWRAAKLAGLNTIPAIVRTIDELQRIELALIENVQREDLSPLDQAVSVQKLHEQFSMSYEKIAERLGKAYSTIANLIRLLQLPEHIQQALHEKKISEGHARTLLSLQNDAKRQSVLFDLILTKHLSVRQAEQFVVASRKQNASVQKATKRLNTETNQTKQLGKVLGTKVTVKYTAKGGAIAVHFKDEAQMNELLERLSR